MNLALMEPKRDKERAHLSLRGLSMPTCRSPPDSGLNESMPRILPLLGTKQWWN